MRTNDPRLYDASRDYASVSGRDLHIDGLLSNLSIGYRSEGMIWDKIFPIVPVNKQSDGYPIWSRADFLRPENAVRAPKARANRITAGVSTDTYFAKNFALGIETAWEDLANADEAFGLREVNTNLIQDNLNMNAEIRMAGRVLNLAAVSSSQTLGSNYSNIGATNPIDDMDNGIEAVRTQTGLRPNKAIFGPQTWLRFRKHPDLIDFIRGKGDNVGGGGVTEAQVAAQWGLNEVLVGNGIQNTAQEGAAAVMSDIWSTHIVLMHVAARPNRMTPSFGYTFQWRPAGFPAPFTVRRYDEEPEMIEVQEVMHFQDEKIVAPELAFIIVGG